MKRVLTIGKRGRALALAAGLTLCAAMAAASGIDSALSAWLGREITIDTASMSEQIPAGGKLTFIYDAGDDVVRVCTRTAPNQRRPWRLDLAAGCNVAMTFTRGQRYCTVEDVKAGDGEVLSSCHRLRSREVALRSSSTSDGVELADVIVFLLSPERGKSAVAILVDSPSRVTDSDVIIGKF
jgi:hypothetical protein